MVFSIRWAAEVLPKASCCKDETYRAEYASLPRVCGFWAISFVKMSRRTVLLSYGLKTWDRLPGSESLEPSTKKALQVSIGLQQLRLSAVQSKNLVPFKYLQGFQGQHLRCLKAFSRAISLSSLCGDCVKFDVLDHFAAFTTGMELTKTAGRHPVGLVPPCIRLSAK